MKCPACRTPVPADSRFCPSCGSSVAPFAGDADRTVASGDDGGGGDETIMTPRPATPRPTPSGAGSSGTAERFPAGTIVAERYRIVGLLGQGGMGEVYRADDLTLGQSVALKFLPEAFAGDDARRTMFFREVRTAREIAHPNVCRVYDIGEVHGQTFLSMEYVDGDDLSSLLRRIGRVPGEKAVDIARQLCGGLAALHDRGILHRDLKPSNVMIDGRGRVRITDFGLAVPAAADHSGQRVGTPAYMAPEQIDGKDIDARADIYALGLVLYEIFTGKRAFEADTFAELARLQREGTPTNPSTLITDLDPSVERVLARCLEKDPDLRPSSAIVVAAALPGGDPIAAALAAGEIPSLEMVAAAGDRGGVSPLRGWLSFAAAAAGIVLFTLVNSQEKLYSYVAPAKSAPVLEDRARELLASFGFDEPKDHSAGYEHDGNVRQWLREQAEEDSTDVNWDRLRELRPEPLFFVYRESPDHLVPVQARGYVTALDPAPVVPGMVQMTLDTSGRLVRLYAVAAANDGEADADSSRGPPVDWALLFEAAGLELAAFTPATPEWVPRTYADERLAWIGEYPDQPGLETRVEAASFDGLPVLFRIVSPWSEKFRPPSDPAGGERAFILFFMLVVIGALALTVFLVVRNVRLHRGDFVGARRVSITLFLMTTAIWVLSAHHIQNLNHELNKFLEGVSASLMVSALVWTFYLALEPYVRKTWPGLLVSWSRLVTGRLRDPLVGRDILAGGVFFLFNVAVGAVTFLIQQALGQPTGAPTNIRWETFQGAHQSLAWIVGWLINALLYTFFILLLLMVLRVTLRKQWIAVLVFTGLVALFTGFTASSGGKIVAAIEGVIIGVAWSYVLVRYGLVTFLVGMYFNQLVWNAPMSLDPGVWWFGASFAVIVAILALTGFGLYTALAGKPVFPERTRNPG